MDDERSWIGFITPKKIEAGAKKPFPPFRTVSLIPLFVREIDQAKIFLNWRIVKKRTPLGMEVAPRVLSDFVQISVNRLKFYQYL